MKENNLLLQVMFVVHQSLWNGLSALTILNPTESEFVFQK